MKKTRSEQRPDISQNPLPLAQIRPIAVNTMPAGFTSGDVFFKSDIGPVPAPVPSPAALTSHKAIPADVPPKLIPPPPPVMFPATPPPIPSPDLEGAPPQDDQSPYQNPEEEETLDPGASGTDDPVLEAPEEEPGEVVPSPAQLVEPADAPGENQPATLVRPPKRLGMMFKQAKDIVEIPLALPGTDFCGSLCVSVEEGHSVVLLLLVKYLETGTQEVTITPDGLRFGDKGGGNLGDLQEEVTSVTGAAAKLQGDIATGGTLIDQVITFLTWANLTILPPRAKIEAVRGPRGAIIGYFQGESLVQFVVTVALVADGPVTHYLDLPFPAILSGGVETYLLPETVDVPDFVRYLSSKNAVGWRGLKIQIVRHRILAKQNALGHTLTWGGSAVVAYAFAAGLLGAFFPDLAVSLSLLAPVMLGAVLVGTVQLWRRTKRDMAAMALMVANRTSWRLMNFARNQVDRTMAQLQGAYKRQFLGEMCPQDVLDTITKLGKMPPRELVLNEQLHGEIITTASFVLDPRAGADQKQLTNALAFVIAETKQKRMGGAAKVAIAVARARVQAILVKVGKVSSKDMTPTMLLDELFSVSLARAKYPVPTTISVPLFDIERDLASGTPITQDRMKKAIAAATLLVEQTGHFLAGKPPDLIKEIPYPKASAPVVGEDFDNNFG